jgi:hypothetical protein
VINVNDDPGLERFIVFKNLNVPLRLRHRDFTLLALHAVPHIMPYVVGHVTPEAFLSESVEGLQDHHAPSSTRPAACQLEQTPAGVVLDLFDLAVAVARHHVLSA